MYVLIIFIFLFLLGISLRFNFWRRNKSGISILMYHKVSPRLPKEKSKKLRVTPENFERQMEYLKKKGYKGISFRELIDYLKEGKTNGRDMNESIVITFDDGYKDNYTYAFPILKKYGYTATIFLVADYIGKENSWDNNNDNLSESLLNLDEIKEMKKAGIEFGSHTLTHKNLTIISKQEAKVEIEGSKEELERILDGKIDFFAYPYGKFNKDIVDMVKDAGFSGACTIMSGKNIQGDNPFLLKRTIIKGNDNMLDFALKLKKGASRL